MIKIFFHIRLFISFEEIVVERVLLTLDGKGRVHEAVGESRVQEQTVPRARSCPFARAAQGVDVQDGASRLSG